MWDLKNGEDFWSNGAEPKSSLENNLSGSGSTWTKWFDQNFNIGVVKLIVRNWEKLKRNEDIGVFSLLLPNYP